MTSNEVKVYATITGGIVIFVLLTVVVEDIRLFEGSRKEYEVFFSNVSGLAVGNAVYYGGMKIGEVTDIRIRQDMNGFLVEYNVDSERTGSFRPRQDSEFSIATDLFNRACLTISLGSPGSTLIAPGDVPYGTDPGEYGSLITKAGRALEQAESVPQNAKDLVINLSADQEELLTAASEALEKNRGKISKTIADLVRFTGYLSDPQNTAGSLVKKDEAHDHMDEVLDKLNSAIPDYTEDAESLNEILSANRKGIAEFTGDFADISVELENTSESTKEFLEDNEDGINGSIAYLNDGMPRFNRFMDDTNRFTEDVVEKRGTFGKYVMDDRFEKEVLKSIDNLNEGIDGVLQYTASSSRLQTFLGFGMQSNTIEWAARTDLYMKMVPNSSKEYFIGASFYLNYDEPEAASGLEPRESLFDGLAFTGLLGWRYFDDSLTLRLGAIESMPGGSLEYCFYHGGSIDTKKTPHITSLQIELRMMDKDYEDWDTEYMARAFVKHDFGNGWILKIGGDDLFNTPRFVMGFAFEWVDQDVKYLTGVLSKAG